MVSSVRRELHSIKDGLTQMVSEMQATIVRCKVALPTPPARVELVRTRLPHVPQWVPPYI